MLLMYIGLLGHNSLLINKEKDLINEELHNNIYLSDAKDGDYFIINNSLKKGIYMELFNFLRNEIIKYPSSEFINILLTLPNWQNYS